MVPMRTAGFKEKSRARCKQCTYLVADRALPVRWRRHIAVRVESAKSICEWRPTDLAFAAVSLLEFLAVSPRLEVLSRRPYTLTDVLTCAAGCILGTPAMRMHDMREPLSWSLRSCQKLDEPCLVYEFNVHIPSSSPFSNANLINPGVSSNLLSRFFQTFSKSGPFSGLTCRHLCDDTPPNLGPGCDTLGRQAAGEGLFGHTILFGKMWPDLEIVHCHKEEAGGHWALQLTACQSL